MHSKLRELLSNIPGMRQQNTTDASTTNGDAANGSEPQVPDVEEEVATTVATGEHDKPVDEIKETNEAPAGEEPGEETEEDVAVADTEDKVEETVEEAPDCVDEPGEGQSMVAAKDPTTEENLVTPTAAQTENTVRDNSPDTGNADTTGGEVMEVNKRPERLAKTQA